jgi:ribosomal protein S6E (S10)
MNDLKLNQTNLNKGLIVLSTSLSAKLRTEGLKVGQYIDPSQYGLDINFSYKIRGGSDISGSPLRIYQNSYNPKKQKVVRRKTPLRVLGAHVNSKTAVLDLFLTPRRNLNVSKT